MWPRHRPVLAPARSGGPCLGDLRAGHHGPDIPGRGRIPQRLLQGIQPGILQTAKEARFAFPLRKAWEYACTAARRATSTDALEVLGVFGGLLVALLVVVLRLTADAVSVVPAFTPAVSPHPATKSTTAAPVRYLRSSDLIGLVLPARSRWGSSWRGLISPLVHHQLGEAVPEPVQDLGHWLPHVNSRSAPRMPVSSGK